MMKLMSTDEAMKRHLQCKTKETKNTTQVIETFAPCMPDQKGNGGPTSTTWQLVSRL